MGRTITATLKLVPVVLALIFVPEARSQTQEVRPNLYVLSIGVADFQLASQYPDLLKGVSGAANDARDIAEQFAGQQGKLYQRVEIITLTNAQATKANILRALESLRKVARAGDTVVVFMAGHGGLHMNQYYCTTYDFNPADGSTRLEWSSFMNVLGTLPGTRMLILDTCHSAAAVGNQAITASQDLLQDGARSGVVVYAACTSLQGSGQVAGGRNGVFTLALLEALRGKADLNGDGVVTMAEMDAYVDNRVRAATNGRQHPTMQRPASISSSYAMVRLGDNNQPVLGTHLTPSSPPSLVQAAGYVEPVHYVSQGGPYINQIKPR